MKQVNIMVKKTLSALMLIAALAVACCAREGTSSGAPAGNPEFQTVASNLEIPWEIVFLPGGDILLTERPGRLRRIGDEEGSYEVPDVYHIGEGGLLGMALDPEFENNRFLYLYLTYRDRDSGEIMNRVDRYIYSAADGLSKRNTIISDIPGSRIHNGGRISFGPDGYLYITTGDASESSLAQERDSLAGKILRIRADGTVPGDNPYDTEVYSYGHRNPQGLAWDDEDRLWATEHGPQGRDELNLIRPGRNYGWPRITGESAESGMEVPIIHSGSDTWAPSGAAYHRGSIYFAGLRGRSLYEAVSGKQADTAQLYNHFEGRYGRLRNVRKGPDGKFYLLTSNRDGRGRPDADDDRVISVDPSVLDREE